ncbi:MAG: helix-turn-helix domain-containing protein [Planctomycetota bacterium]
MRSPTCQSAPQAGKQNEGASETPDHTPILVDAKQASAMLAISARKTWELTNCGAIPCVRIGRAVRYRVSNLNKWVAAGCPSRKEGGQ